MDTMDDDTLQYTPSQLQDFRIQIEALRHIRRMFLGDTVNQRNECGWWSVAPSVNQ